MDNRETIYLDHAAATPVDERVISVMAPYLSDSFFNPASPYAPALKVRRDYEVAKEQLAALIGGKADEIIMTAGATESINLAMDSVDGHIVTSNIEHYAVLESAKRHDYTLVESEEDGIVSAESVSRAIGDDTRLVSIALANNELGTIQPIKDIAFVVRSERQRRLEAGNKLPIYLHCDASQGVGQLDIHVSRLGVDMLTVNAGKIYGPKQLGLLWAASEVRLKPSIVGGGQERGIRSGTENVAGVIGFAKALYLTEKHRNSEVRRLGQLRDRMESALLTAFPDAIVSGAKKKRLASHLHISFPGIDAERLIFRLESRNVLVATGSACAANKGTRSHVLTAIGLDPVVADGSLRITLGKLSNEDNISRALNIIIEEVSSEYGRVGKK